MSFYIEMVRLREHLTSQNVRTLIPDGRELELSFATPEQFDAYKRKVSFRYLDQIRHWITDCILVVNHDRHGIQSYIGPSTFAEVAVAAVHRKRIYLLNDFCAEYEEELQSWDAVALHGRLDRLIDEYNEQVGLCQLESDQLKLPGF